ncbi:MAG: hypothetical protein WDZ54_13205 [Sneathiella sp.]
MSDQLLAPLIALGKGAPVIETIGGITICENPDFAIASIAVRNGREKDIQTSLLPVIGRDLPGPGRAVLAGETSAIWIGSGQWFLLAPLGTHPDYACELKDILTDTASVTEQTDGWVVFDITGHNLIPLLERLCDLNSKTLTAGDATRCLIEHLGCLIICRESGRNFTLLGPRSSAVSLHHTLVTAAHSVA